MKKFINKGLKLTPQRAAIFEYLDGNKSHPSAEDIYLEIKKRYPMISFATVYKTLEALKSRGDILELSVDPERRRYDPDTGPHHHLICIINSLIIMTTLIIKSLLTSLCQSEEFSPL